MKALPYTKAEAATAEVNRFQRQYADALQSFTEIVSFWRDMSSKLLKSAITFDDQMVDGSVASGSILGQPFRINVVPQLRDNGVVAKCIVSVTDYLGRPQVRAVFLHSRGADVLSEEGDVIAARSGEHCDYLWLCNLIAIVLRAG